MEPIKRKVGRPKTGQAPTTPLRISAELMAQVEYAMKLQGKTNKAEIMREAMKLGLEAMERQISPPIQFPLICGIAAGNPVNSASQSDKSTETVSVPAHLAKKIRKGEKAFVLRVNGESMIGEGINDKDLVFIVERDPKIGDIVAAQVDGDGFTLKTLVLRNGKPVLVAANPKNKDIEPAERLDIRHVYVGKI